MVEVAAHVRNEERASWSVTRGKYVDIYLLTAKDITEIGDIEGR